MKHEPLWKVPSTFTSFIGREQEVATIAALLRRPAPGVRLLTLLGVGGIGKTRLSLQVAEELRPSFSAGVCFVPLAAITDPELVVPTIAQELGIPEIGSQLLAQLKVALRDKQLLLILDNFEYVVNASPQIEDLLAACPALKIVVTSCAVLDLQAEQQFPVFPLALPNLQHLPEHEVLATTAAVALFVQRAQASLPAFHLTPTNALTIAEICVCLDGLPLAIVLAAARIKLFSLPALLKALRTQLFQVLTSRVPTVPERQQTLRDTFRWSYDLLAPEEQRFFRRLSVFVGGWSPEAVTAVVVGDQQASSGSVSALEGLASLLDNSLLLRVQEEGKDLKLIMLETLREYGRECLRESGEAEESYRTHALYYLSLAERAEPHLKGAAQKEWLDQLEEEQENLRAALGWLVEQQEAELALRLSSALWWFWYVRGYWSEGRRGLEAALALPQLGGRTAARAKALRGVGTLALYQRDYDAAPGPLEESAAIYREVGDKGGLAGSLGELGYSKYRQNDVAAARRLLEESIGIARAVKDTWTLAYVLWYLGWVADKWGDHEGAFLLVKESEVLFRALGDTHGLTYTLSALSRIVLEHGNQPQAVALAEESLSLARAVNNTPDVIDALHELANSAEYLGEYGQAEALTKEQVKLARELGDRDRIARALCSLGGYELRRDDFSRASTCLEESLALVKEMGFKGNIAVVLCDMGKLSLMEGDVVQAAARYTEGLALALEAGSKISIGSSLVGLAKVAAAEAQSERAAQLFGAASSCGQNTFFDFSLWVREDYECIVKSLRAHLGEAAFAAAWDRGRAMTPEQILAEQTHRTPAAPPSAHPRPKYPDGLTESEVKVLRLVAEGLRNKEVAERLGNSPRTVSGHLRSIYSKINVRSRTEAARYATEHHLVDNHPPSPDETR